jgi:NAD(P)-dependent dehydrogenase (short-subunit alcohol dehydrogenase family)
VALVTGAAGGIGRAVVARLAADGYRVVAVDVSPAVAELAAQGRVATLAADLTADGAAERAVALAGSAFGRLDVLVNNAGRFLRKPIAETTDADFDRVFAINVRAPFRLSRLALPQLESTAGCIVNVPGRSTSPCTR